MPKSIGYVVVLGEQYSMIVAAVGAQRPLEYLTELTPIFHATWGSVSGAILAVESP
jgi:hypothetical protein